MFLKLRTCGLQIPAQAAPLCLGLAPEGPTSGCPGGTQTLNAPSAKHLVLLFTTQLEARMAPVDQLSPDTDFESMVQ